MNFALKITTWILNNIYQIRKKMCFLFKGNTFFLIWNTNSHSLIKLLWSIEANNLHGFLSLTHRKNNKETIDVTCIYTYKFIMMLSQNVSSHYIQVCFKFGKTKLFPKLIWFDLSVIIVCTSHEKKASTNQKIM